MVAMNVVLQFPPRESCSNTRLTHEPYWWPNSGLKHLQQPSKLGITEWNVRAVVLRQRRDTVS